MPPIASGGFVAPKRLSCGAVALCMSSVFIVSATEAADASSKGGAMERRRTATRSSSLSYTQSAGPSSLTVIQTSARAPQASHRDFALSLAPGLSALGTGEFTDLSGIFQASSARRVASSRWAGGLTITTEGSACALWVNVITRTSAVSRHIRRFLMPRGSCVGLVMGRTSVQSACTGLATESILAIDYGVSS